MSVEHKYSIQFSNKIWSSAYDTSNDIIAIELRNEYENQISFALIEVSSGSEIKMISPDIDWCSSIINFEQGYLIVVEYEDENTPTPIRSKIINTRNEELHVLDSCTFQYKNDKDFVFKSPSEEKIYFSLDANDLETSSLRSPMIYSDESKHYKEIQEFIVDINRETSPFGPIEYLELNNHVALSYYVKEEKLLNNYFLVVDDKPLIIFKEIIDENLKGFGMDSFFCINNFVLYFKEKKSLECLEIL